jgi:hypothetical protein
MATGDPIKELAAAGIPIDLLPPEFRSVLAGLSDAETRVLVEVNRRLLDAAEVAGYLHTDLLPVRPGPVLGALGLLFVPPVQPHTEGTS